MSVRCPQCFYENEEQYRFCGMCGTPLPRLGTTSEEDDVKVGRTSAAAAGGKADPAKERAPVPMTGPSFLGLSQDQNPYPDRSLDYLLEDEPEPGHKRIYLAVLLLIAAVAMLAWRWRHSGFFTQTHPTVVTTPNDTTSSSPDASTPATSAPPTEPAPTPSSSSETTTGIPPAQASQAPTAESAKPADSGQSNAAADNSTASTAKPESPSTATATSVPEQKPAPVPAPTVKASPKIPKEPKVPSAPPLSAQDMLVAEGEKYLYGNGVPQNCGRAEKSLLLAAQHASSKAESVLGTMYATGHCVGRDLPTAYRWFAKASHQDPSNDRITRDLEVLWKQMTAGERQLAINNRE
ncbi:MAG: hypothetical protein WB421_10480 [Terriglobales bacterium]